MTQTSNSLSAITIDDVMNKSPVIAVATVSRVADGVALARCLMTAGISVIEVTLRSEAALQAITEIASIDGVIVGAGTVLVDKDVERASEAGAKFLVSPGLTESVVRRAQEAALPYLPGVSTPSEIMRGMQLGVTRFKFFPAEACGGVAALAAFEGPFSRAAFCPTGGIHLGNAAPYLQLANVSCVGSGWLAPPELLDKADWVEISRRAQACAKLERSNKQLPHNEPRDQATR